MTFPEHVIDLIKKEVTDVLLVELQWDVTFSEDRRDYMHKVGCYKVEDNEVRVIDSDEDMEEDYDIKVEMKWVQGKSLEAAGKILYDVNIYDKHENKLDTYETSYKEY